MARNISDLKSSVEINVKNINPHIPKSIKVISIPEIHSQIKDYRLKLRQRILLELNKTSLVDSKILLDLNSRPIIPQFNISISHCPLGSTFIYSEKIFQVGIDIEAKTRIKPPLIKRVSSPKEIANCPQSTLLFSAKEAGWKALQDLPIATISQLETCRWQQLNNHWYQFEIQFAGNKLDGYGFTYEFSDTYLSFYYTPSTFIEKHRQK